MTKNILQEILYNKTEWLKNYKKKYPLQMIQKSIQPSNRDFYHTVKITKPCFILEIKKASPLKGLLNINFNIKNIIKYYKQHATVISVITEEKFFQGQLKYLNTVHQLVQQPILCKDFFIDPYQIYLARYYNADAILLMLSILSDDEYSSFLKIAHNLNMGVLTEINNVDELNRALKFQAKVIGINNRNLNDFKINISKTYHLAPLIPKNKIIISESGITNNRQVKQLNKIVDGFLIGSSIMTSKNMSLKINSIIFGNHKLCGLTKPEDAEQIEKFGAVYGGLIFVPISLRRVTLHQAENIMLHAPLKYIGVFQNEKVEKVIFIAKQLPLDAIQLHGNENQEYINHLRKHIPTTMKIWKALYITHKIQQLNLRNVNYYLFDNNQGGSGLCFDWSKIKSYNLRNVFLSGGLSIENYVSAAKLDCFGYDFNSKLEKRPGVKDYNKIEQLFKRIKLL